MTYVLKINKYKLSCKKIKIRKKANDTHRSVRLKLNI